MKCKDQERLNRSISTEGKVSDNRVEFCSSEQKKNESSENKRPVRVYKTTSDLVLQRLCLAIDGKDSCRLTRKETTMSRKQN